MLATNVLLATLVIPVSAEKAASEAYLEIDSTQEKQQRLALLVGLTQVHGRVGKNVGGFDVPKTVVRSSGNAVVVPVGERRVFLNARFCA